ncbi:hypothetical protein BDV12DRAFT_205208 [Aspergillus spectabilis]
MSVVYDILWQWRRHFQTNQESDGANSDPVGGDHMNIDFDRFGLADAFTFEWPDSAFDIPLGS